jgi:hypothetical protein
MTRRVAKHFRSCSKIEFLSLRSGLVLVVSADEALKAGIVEDGPFKIQAGQNCVNTGNFVTPSIPKIEKS